MIVRVHELTKLCSFWPCPLLALDLPTARDLCLSDCDIIIEEVR